MIKDPKEPFNPSDKLGLPPDFGKPKDPTVIPFGTPGGAMRQPPTSDSFGRRPVPPSDRLEPLKESLRPPRPEVIDYQLSADEIMALRVYLDDRTTTLLSGDLQGMAGTTDEDTPLNMLKVLINDIERGKLHPVSLFIGMIDYKRDGTENYPFYVTGMSRMALRGLLHEYLENLP